MNQHSCHSGLNFNARQWLVCHNYLFSSIYILCLTLTQALLVQYADNQSLLMTFQMETPYLEDKERLMFRFLGYWTVLFQWTMAAESRVFWRTHGALWHLRHHLRLLRPLFRQRLRRPRHCRHHLHHCCGSL